MSFDHIDWSRAFFKTLYENRSTNHMPVERGHSPAFTLSASVLVGAIATVIMIFATWHSQGFRTFVDLTCAIT